MLVFRDGIHKMDVRIANREDLYCLSSLFRQATSVRNFRAFTVYVVLYFQLEKYVSPSKLKYYFAVDTTYVGKKLAMLLFPYTHTVSLSLLTWASAQ